MRHLEKLGRLALRRGPRDGALGSQAVATRRVEPWDQATNCSAEEQTRDQIGPRDGFDECGNAGFPAATLHEECCTSSRGQSAVQVIHQTIANDHHHSSPARESYLLDSCRLRRPLRSPFTSDSNSWQQIPARGFAASALTAESVGTVLRERYVPSGGFLALNNIRDNPGAKREVRNLSSKTSSSGAAF